MAAAMAWLSPANGRRVSCFPPRINATVNKAKARSGSGVPSFTFFSSPCLRSGGETSFLVPYLKEKQTDSNYLVITTAALTPRSQWEEEENGNRYKGQGQSQGQGQGRRRETSGVSFFVGNLPYSVDSAELLELFKDAGDVTMVEVIYNKETGRSRGFAFVTMATAGDVSEAVERFNGYEYQGRSLRVSSGPPPPKNNFSHRVGFRNEKFSGGGGGGGGGGANKLFVGNLPWGADNLTLEELFSDHGKVKDARIVYDRETGRSRGFGFVTMSSFQEVESAISSLHGADMDGRPLLVTVAEAKPAQF